jgi:hypothetical protein
MRLGTMATRKWRVKLLFGHVGAKRSRFMTHLGLMSRARELLVTRVAGSALVILPLAAAVPARADTSFVFDSDTISRDNFATGGAALGDANYSLINGQTIDLLGDTKGTAFGVPYVTDEEAFGSSSGKVFSTDSNTVTATIEYTWSGYFAPHAGRLDGTDQLVVGTDIVTNILQNQGDGGTVAWTLNASVSSYSGRTLANGTLSSDDGSNPLFITPFASGKPDSWQVTLDLEWTFQTGLDSNKTIGAAFPQDALDADSKITMSLSTPSGATVATTPLPASVWSGGTLLGILGMGAFFRNARLRRMA